MITINLFDKKNGKKEKKLRKFYMCLNPVKCSIRVWKGKVSRFYVDKLMDRRQLGRLTMDLKVIRLTWSIVFTTFQITILTLV